MYAEKTGNKGTVAFENECIAISLLELNNPVEAKKYAERSLELYRTLAGQNKDEFFAVAVSRVANLVSETRTELSVTRRKTTRLKKQKTH